MKLHQPLELAQDAQHLQYAVFLGEHAPRFSRAGLTIVQEGRVGVGPYGATVAIIGESHFVSIDDRRWTWDRCRSRGVRRSANVRRTADDQPQLLRHRRGAHGRSRRGWRRGGVAVAARLSQHAGRDAGWVLARTRAGNRGTRADLQLPLRRRAADIRRVRMDRSTGARGRLPITTMHEYVGPVRPTRIYY